MLVSILFILIVCLNAYAVYVNRDCKTKQFGRYVLFLLFLGLLRFLIGYSVSVFLPHYLYKSTAFPVSLLYGGAIYIYFNLSIGKHMQNVVMHVVPFLVGLVGYFSIMANSSWLYLYYHEFYIIVYFLSTILFITYILIIGLGFYSGVDYSLKSFLKEGKSFIIPICLLILFVGILVIKVIKRGDMELYLAFNFLFYLLVLLSIIKFSKSTKVIDRNHIEEVSNGYLNLGKDDFKQTLLDSRFILERDLEISYQLEIEKFIASKLYLDVDLNKDIFREKVNIPQAHLTPFLKKKYGKSFNGFVNDLRLNYAAKELSRNELVYTIDDLSFVCGFRSRASFYRNFINAFGCSPHQYRKSRKKNA